jgi:hypothetical protein
MTTLTRLKSMIRPRTVGLLATIVALVSGAAVAWAYWSASGSGSGGATVATFNAPTSVIATTTSGTSTVSLSWSAATLSTGQAAQGYYVTRVKNSDSSTAAACGTSSSSLVTAPSCNDTSVADGSYHYVVTAVYHSWTAVSGSSNNVTVVSTRPDVSINQAAGQADPTNASSINFTAVFSESVTDFSGSSVTVGGTAPGTKIVTVTGSGNTYNVAISGMTGTGTVTASIAANVVHDANGAGNTASTSTDNTVSYDGAAPTAPAPAAAASVTFGTSPIYVNNETVTFTDAATDSGSGVASVSYYYCAGATGSCTATNGTLIGTSTSGATYSVTSGAPFAVTDGTYRVVAVVTDNAGNKTTSNARLVAVDTTPPTVSRPTVNGHS